MEKWQWCQMIYVSLHTHTTFSFGDGFGTVEDHVKRIADLGMSAIGLTEHGNVSSFVRAEQTAKRYNICPVYGIEAYVSAEGERRKTHLTILASNEDGYRNLCRIVTQSYKDFYQYPTVTWESLKAHNDGLIILSGCSDSELSCTLLGGKSYGDKRMEFSDYDIEHSIGVVERYKKVFGDRYYIEVQRFPQLKRTCILNSAFEEIGKHTGTLLAATADVHYPFSRDSEMQKILHASHRGSSVDIVDSEWEYSIKLTYPESDQEIYQDLRRTGLSREAAKSAVEATAEIAERCR